MPVFERRIAKRAAAWLIAANGMLTCIPTSVAGRAGAAVGVTTARFQAGFDNSFPSRHAPHFRPSVSFPAEQLRDRQL